MRDLFITSLSTNMISNQSWPTDWINPPEGFFYDEKTSISHSVPSEPEYVITDDEEMKLIIREYEDGRRELSVTDQGMILRKEIPPDENINPVLTDVFSFIQCKYKHTPYNATVSYRGYNTTENQIYNYTSNNVINKKNPSNSSASAFFGYKCTNMSENQKNSLNRLLEIRYEHKRSVPKYTTMSYNHISKEVYYETHTVVYDSNETKHIHPLPSIELLPNRLEEIKDELYTVSYINNDIKDIIVSRVI